MTNKVELNELTQVVHKEQAFLVALNENFLRLQQAINDTLSRTGVVPNQMEEVLDMNGKRIVNVGAAVEDNDVVTRAFINVLIADVEAAVARLDTLVTQAQQALELYAAEHIYPVAQAAVDAAEAARDAAKGYYDDTKDLYDALADVRNNLSTLLALGNDLTNIDAVAGDLTNIDALAQITSDITTCATNIQAILDAQTYAGNAAVWAEGTDAQVEALGGEHSAKKWAELAEQDMTVSLKNLATGNNSLMILGNASTNANATGVGVGATADSNCSTAIGWSVKASSMYSTAVGSFTTEAKGAGTCAFGYSAIAKATGAIQIGKGTNATAGTVCFGITTDGVNWTNYTVLDATGKVPAARLPIATSVSSLSTNDETVGAKLFYDTCGDIETLINAL